MSNKNDLMWQIQNTIQRAKFTLRSKFFQGWKMMPGGWAFAPSGYTSTPNGNIAVTDSLKILNVEEKNEFRRSDNHSKDFSSK